MQNKRKKKGTIYNISTKDVTVMFGSGLAAEGTRLLDIDKKSPAYAGLELSFLERNG